MSGPSLPERPDLDQLRRQAKELKEAARAGQADALARVRGHFPATEPVTLAAAQLVIAREHGLPSWPALKAEVEARNASLTERVDMFLHASLRGPIRRAVRLLADDPGIATYDFRTAVVLGDVERLRQAMAADPGLALRPVPPVGWPPLLGACNSRWHKGGAERADGLLAVARLLLDAGADPNTRVEDTAESTRCSTLFGAAGCSNNPAMTELLLARGAVPDDETLYLAAFSDDHECVRLMLPHMPNIADSTALAAPISMNDIDGVRILLDGGVNPNRALPADLFGEQHKGGPVGTVAAAVDGDCSVELITLLLERGADPDTPGRGGLVAYQLALRHGRTDVAELLLRHGATDSASAIDRLLAACRRADNAEARRLVDADPGLVGTLTDTDRGDALRHAADSGDIGAVTLMLDVGFPVDSRSGEEGGTALHTAAGAGSVGLVRLLIDRGADLEANDTTWQSPPLDWAIVGSGMRLGHDPAPDWIATVQALIDAGASLEDIAWGPVKPPSDEVAELLRGYGVGPVPDQD
ncbi:MAG TPA: ankyrin repeat domain-containing protein [Pseudonocardiaceae bacterium]|nr:ankyrin repeat domain-containing protein [Pseudonocardiaceae bacterium]